MSDEEKIKQAAKEYDANNSYNSGYGPSYAFTDGIEWRDKNPSPKTVAYIKSAETMIKLQQCPMDDTATWHKIMTEGNEAVKAIKENGRRNE